MSATIPSPRTADEPMAFTRSEFWRGAMRAWGAFLVLLLTLEVVASVITDLTYRAQTGVAHVYNLPLLPVLLLMSLLVGGVISGLSLLIGIPIAYRVGRALRRERRMAVHLAVYSAFGFIFGALVGGASYFVALSGSAASVGLPALYAGLIAGGLSAAAVAFGWWTITRDVLRTHRDVPRRRRPRVDPDAAYEDNL